MSKISATFRNRALRSGVIVRASRSYETPEHIRFAASVEMLNLGFKVLPDQLNGMSESAMTKMISDARNIIGADRDMRPIYPGFPKQVQDLDTLTLLVEQILHYWTAGAFLPDYPDVVREGLPLADMVRNVRETVVKTAGEAAKHLINDLTRSGVAMSEDDRTLLTEAVQVYVPSKEEATAILRGARNGENIQVFVSALAGKGAIDANSGLMIVAPLAKNADQLLRAILALATTPVEGREEDYARAVENLSNRDATSVRMVTIGRPARRAVLSRLAEVTGGFYADTLVTRQDLWRRVMRMIHPYSFITSGTPEARAVDIIHSNIEHKTLNSLVEEGMAEGNADKVITLLSEHQPGNLLRRLVAILRMVRKVAEARKLADAVRTHAVRSPISTLVSSYNGVISANDNRARVTRVAGRNNHMLENNRAAVNIRYVNIVSEAILDALRAVLATKDAPTAPVGVASEQAMPLVRRDLASTDRTMDRGQRIITAGEGDTLRVFSHWKNTSNRRGYMDLAAIVLDEDFNVVSVSTWNTWQQAREWSTYSGDKLVYPGRSAAEYYDIDLAKVKVAYPRAAWVAITIQSWSGIPFKDVDIIAGAMLRSEPNSGEVFDPRTVASAFTPTTDAFQSVPMAVNLDTRELAWLDSSSGSTDTGVSAADDATVGSIVYDEVARPRLTMGEVATLWAEAHNMDTVDEPVDRDAILGLLN